LVVVDPCRLLREGVTQIFASSSYSVIACAETLAEVLHSVPLEEDPDLLLWGIEDQHVLQACLSEFCELRERIKGLRTILIANPSDGQSSQWAAAMGIEAVLSKDISGEVLLRCVEVVILGQQLYPALVFAPAELQSAAAACNSPVSVAPLRSSVKDSCTDPLRSGTILLSKREDEILHFLLSGSRDKQIALDLGISEATVKVHVRALLRKLGASNRTQVAIWGMSRGRASAHT